MSAAMERALRWERGVHLAAHPLAYPLALGFRRLGAVVDVPGIGHVVSDAAVARAVLEDVEHFSKNGPGSAGELITQVMGEYALLNLEGAAHRVLRALLLPALAAPALRDTVHAIWSCRLDEAAAVLRDGGRVDLARLAAILTGRTMRVLLGMAAAGDGDAESIATFELGEEMTRVVRLRQGALSRRAVQRAQAQYERLTVGIAAARSTAPPDSIIGRLRSAGLDERQTRGVGAALLLTGTGTVSTALPRLVAILSDAELWGMPGDRKARLAVVDECLRVITPSPATLRSVERDTVIAGHHFRAGQRVLILTYLAVRDFPDGAAFAPGRVVPAAARGLVFGAGEHHCIGYALARAELDLSLERLQEVAPLRVVRRVPALRVLIPRYRILEVARAA